LPIILETFVESFEEELHMKKREFIVQDLLSKIYQEEFKEGKLPNQRELSKKLWGFPLYDPASDQKFGRNRHRSCGPRLRDLYS
jgi:hypothetical protein